jgi:hypothetical protein
MYRVIKDNKYIKSNRSGNVQFTTELDEAKTWKSNASAKKVADSIEGYVEAENFFDFETAPDQQSPVYKARVTTITNNSRDRRRYILDTTNTLEGWMLQKEEMPKCQFEIFVDGNWQSI